VQHHFLKHVARVAVLGALAAAVTAAPAQAKHSWAGWHWERAANPAQLQLIDNTTDESGRLSQNWPVLLTGVVSDWTASSVLDVTARPADVVQVATRETCAPLTGFIRTCNVDNPDLTWLGLAVVLNDPLAGDDHVVAASAMVNDNWFRTPLYDTTAARHVLCQEVGHTFGLDHQDDSGADLNTCMDYADALDNPSPNAHDYQQLEAIYSHLDGSGSGGGSANKGGKGGGGKGGGGKGGGKGSAKTPPSGMPFNLPAGYHGTAGHRSGGHTETFVSQRNGRTVVQFVAWAY